MQAGGGFVTEGPSTSQSACDWHERGRHCVYGYLCPMVLHETNNVLTVMAGIRQILGQGRTLSDRIGPMIDGQLEKMDRLLGWIHGMGEDDAAAGGARTLAMVAGNLEQLLGLASKGRRTRLQVECGDAPVQGQLVEALSLASLCTLLPMLPPRAPGATVEIVLRLDTSPAAVRSSARVSPCRFEPLDHPDVRLAASLVRGDGGAYSCERTEDGAATVEIELPSVG